MSIALRYLSILLIAVLAEGCYGRYDSASSDYAVKDIVYNTTLEALHGILGSKDVVAINEDLVICGAVTANDEGGNFYKSFVIEQGGYAAEILDGLTYSYVRFEEGYLVTVELNGLCIARSRGVLQIGVEAALGSGYDIDYLGHEILVDRHIVSTGVEQPISPRTLQLSEFDGDDGALLMEQLCGTLVTIEGLTFLPDEDEYYGASGAMWGGTRDFEDGEGYQMQSYCSDYSSFSLVLIPTAEVSLTGILQSDGGYGDGLPMVKMRSVDDCVVR